MDGVEKLVVGNKVLIKKGVESISEEEYFMKKFPEDITGMVTMLFPEDNDLVRVHFMYDRTPYTLNYRLSDLVKIKK